jgi:hypothetical protein
MNTLIIYVLGIFLGWTCLAAYNGFRWAQWDKKEQPRWDEPELSNSEIALACGSVAWPIALPLFLVIFLVCGFLHGVFWISRKVFR